MRLAAMQPYFFPYLGYFSLIAATDRFVIFDPVQYIRHGWVNRNRILRPTLDAPQYITVPVAKHPRATPIRDIQIASQPRWKNRIIGQLQHYKRSAPFFDEVMSLVRECIDGGSNSLVELNVRSLTLVCERLKLPFDPISYSEIEDQVGTVSHPGDWAVQISAALGASDYLNPNGGRELFDAGQFAAAGIQLGFIQNNLREYSQQNSSFVGGLSILDVLMFNDLQETNKLIRDYKLLQPDPSTSCI